MDNTQYYNNTTIEITSHAGVRYCERFNETISFEQFERMVEKAYWKGIWYKDVPEEEKELKKYIDGKRFFDDKIFVFVRNESIIKFVTMYPCPEEHLDRLRELATLKRARIKEKRRTQCQN